VQWFPLKQIPMIFMEPNDTEVLPDCRAGWQDGVYSGRGFLAILVKDELNV